MLRLDYLALLFSLLIFSHIPTFYGNEHPIVYHLRGVCEEFCGEVIPGREGCENFCSFLDHIEKEHNHLDNLVNSFSSTGLENNGFLKILDYAMADTVQWKMTSKQ
tara:strand:+ start:146 stop:463 length:318 start_codon:yes stop_codon:yes gene_type:complete